MPETCRFFSVVPEWAGQHQVELMEDWTSLATTGTFKRIEPLV